MSTTVLTSALHRALVDSPTIAAIGTDETGVIRIFNRGAERMLGYPAADVIGKLTPADLAESRELIARAFTASHPIENTYSLSFIRKGGTRFAAVVSITSLRDARDAIIGYLLIATDDTVRTQLENASRMKSEFLMNMSHELRTPLNAIIGFSEVLRDGLMGEMTEEQRGFIGAIFSSGTHLLALINDILDLSKGDAGKLTLDLEPVPIASFLVNGLAVVKERAASRHVHLELDTRTAEGLGSIQADPRKVKQILSNLLSTAIAFTNEGGRVSLLASRDSLLEKAFSEFLKISVNTTGMAIPKEGLARLFTPFSGSDTASVRTVEGTGLGLAMVKLLAELHGGAVTVENTDGEGSRFIVWLPFRNIDADTLTEAAVPAAPAAEAPEGTRTALVVEDDDKAAQLIRLYLEAEGFTVIHAVSAEAALTLAVQQPLSLITLDIKLPNMDGWEFLNRVKQVPALSRIPVVIISIGAERSKGFALGAAAVMQKPISRQELYDSLVDLGLFPVSEGQTLKVLVVDDDPKAVELTAVRILGLANVVLRAYGGREAIEAARHEVPDLIVLDLMMPQVDGFDVVQALNEQPDTARIPILAVTARQITGEEQSRLNGSMSATVEQAGFDADRFAAEVRRALSGRPASAWQMTDRRYARTS